MESLQRWTDGFSDLDELTVTVRIYQLGHFMIDNIINHLVITCSAHTEFDWCRSLVQAGDLRSGLSSILRLAWSLTVLRPASWKGQCFSMMVVTTCIFSLCCIDYCFSDLIDYFAVASFLHACLPLRQYHCNKLSTSEYGVHKRCRTKYHTPNYIPPKHGRIQAQSTVRPSSLSVDWMSHLTIRHRVLLTAYALSDSVLRIIT